MQSDKDLVTLVTCTPYGINSHRLLVQGERVEDDITVEQIYSPTTTGESTQSNNSQTLDSLPTLIIVGISCGGIFLVAILIFAVGGRHRAKVASKSTPTEDIDSLPPDP